MRCFFRVAYSENVGLSFGRVCNVYIFPNGVECT